MKTGDFVKIVLHEFSRSSDKNSDIVIGTIISISPVTPHLEPHSPLQPGPVYDIKVLTANGTIWKSWIDQRDSIEIINELKQK